MNFVDMIIKKRDGQLLSPEDIDFFVHGVVMGEIPDYQISAMLMAMFLRGMTDVETAGLTLSMAREGDMLDLSGVVGVKVDKHSTGGVADTTTLILAPLVASLGVPVVKMSGRGLGFTGGTIDKLEAIPGFKTEIVEKEAIQNAKGIGIVIMGQTKNIAPADKKLYALRDVTGSIDSIPLIASSIMSKKIAAGADCIVLDVKCGSGAFMRDYKSAKSLAEKMVSVGQSVGRKVAVIISSMDEPLGSNIGNALEVIEAIEILKGVVGGALLDVALELGAYMILLAGKAVNVGEGRQMLLENIKNGLGLKKLRELIERQGGDARIIDNYLLLPQAKTSHSLKAERSGFVSGMDCARIGRASIETGAGRVTKEDKLDYGAGIIMRVRLGDYVEVGQTLADVYASDSQKCENAAAILNKAIMIGDTKPMDKKLILGGCIQ